VRTVYIIFSVAGWAWFAVAIGYLWYRSRADRRTRRARGFEVVPNDAKQH
jgi:hypothetical protein